MMDLKRFTGLTPIICGLVLILAGCRQDQKTQQSSDDKAVAKHEHVAPHGGTAIELGNEEFHLELVLDRPTGRLIAYVLDGHLENFVRIQASSFEIDAQDATGQRSLVFKAVSNPTTGEKVGDTSMFEVTAEWLKSATAFDGKLKELEIRGKRYTGVTFNFPKGNETAGHK